MRYVSLGLGALLLLAGSAFGSASAPAGTLVYVKGGRVYVARTDGTQARPVTKAGNGWVWPSETDRGVIAVAGGLPRTTATFDSSGGDLIYEFDQNGRQLAGPVPTQGTYSTVNDPEYVAHFRVAPDNSYVAWTDISSFTDPFTSWRKPNGVGSFRTAGRPPAPYESPEWWGPKNLLITHDGVTFGSTPEYAIYSVANGSSKGWSDDEAIGDASSYQVTISRNGRKFAVMTDDSPDNAGRIRHIAISLETTSARPVTAPVVSTHCSITPPPSRFATRHGALLASMSFSADGSLLAWGQDDGIYEANVADPSDCAAVRRSTHRVVPGGSMPFLGAAPLRPAS
ncbi:MAG TPA: hypothetical protein VFA66_13595 [Gaiellaceae bacterium]|nr:hypothetical protein [Gaiellaceae bacterium]